MRGIVLAALLSFGVVPAPAAALQSTKQPSERAQTARADTVGQRLAADLQWTQAERNMRFGHMDRLFPVHRVVRSGDVRPLPRGRRLPLSSAWFARYMRSEHLLGVLVLQDGRIRAERYAGSLTPASRWATFSVTKAVTDTLAGCALHSGSLRSLDDGVVQYLPEMKGSAYDGVTVRQLMTMTSGVRWREDYTDPTADNALLYSTAAVASTDPVIAYMRQLPREREPGTQWHYNTGETDLLGVLLRRATGKTLAQQLSTTVWRSAGMRSDATWVATAGGSAGQEFGGSGLSTTLRDLGRLGVWMLNGGHGVVSADWVASATRAQVAAGAATYGFGWWPQKEAGSAAALGIFGQSLLIDPERRLVIVTLGNWPEATGAKHSAARAQFWRAVQSAVDRPRS